MSERPELDTDITSNEVVAETKWVRPPGEGERGWSGGSVEG